MISHSSSDFVHTREIQRTRFYGFNDNQTNWQNESPKNSKISDIFTEFCERSTIHGVRHFVDQNLHWMERAWWMIVIISSTVMCFVSIHNLWSNWKDEPIIVAAETKSFPINNIPFPAVSICPFAITSSHKFNYSEAYRLLRKIDGNSSRDLTATELKLMKLVSQYCFEEIAPNVTNEFPGDYLEDNDVWDTINEIAPPFNETFIFCKLFSKWIDCNKLFVPQITERGLCYTFNTLNANELFTNETAPELQKVSANQPQSNWNFGFDHSGGNSERYPHSAYSSSQRSSLTVVFKVLKADLDYLCSGGSQGFTVSLHLPNEGPQTHKRYFYVPLEQSVLLTVRPIFGEPSRDVRAHPSSMRRCYLYSERQLRFYKQYTLHNCRTECISNYTLARCGCVKYSMPRPNGTRICGPGKIECYKRIDSTVLRCDEIRLCNCLPTCLSLNYDASSSHMNYNFGSSYSRSVFKPKYGTKNARFSRLIVKFQNERASASKLVDSLDYLEFCTKVGGIFSLFVGASLISFIELVYYFTLRLFFTYLSNQ